MLIIHRCQVCLHPDYWAEGTTVAAPNSRAAKAVGIVRRIHCNALQCGTHRQCQWGPPELTREWVPFTGALIERVRQPGKFVRGLGTTCNCDDCRALYATLIAMERSHA